MKHASRVKKQHLLQVRPNNKSLHSTCWPAYLACLQSFPSGWHLSEPGSIEANIGYVTSKVNTATNYLPAWRISRSNLKPFSHDCVHMLPCQNTISNLYMSGSKMLEMHHSSAVILGTIQSKKTYRPREFQVHCFSAPPVLVFICLRISEVQTPGSKNQIEKHCELRLHATCLNGEKLIFGLSLTKHQVQTLNILNSILGSPAMFPIRPTMKWTRFDRSDYEVRLF